jgi:NCS1 family nucleobase:cation symporter-1
VLLTYILLFSKLTIPLSVNYLFLWLSDGANVGTMQQAGSIVAMGLSWREASVAM